ncbi:DUF2804 domain-containing protein [Treponema sp.]|uniref:DUF2804 domain-containing protein n=1 Tax=Treponema sp. TaxID=166 RepID=UPI003EFDAE85
MPNAFVQDGKPVFGTFKGHPKRFDIRGIFRPYGVVPLPTFITNLRIKSRLVFSFDIGEFIGRISFIDAKIAGFCEVLFWNKNTSQKFAYRSLLGPRKRLIPHSLEAASTSNYSRRRYTRISWNRSQNRLSVVFSLKGDSVRPLARAALSAVFSDSQFSELTSVRPNPTMRRSHASYSSVLPLYGTLTLSYKNGETKTVSSQQGICSFGMTRTYMKFRSHGKSVLGIGEVKGKKIVVKISCDSTESVDMDRYNCNVLFYDGKATPLPPVLISHYSGMDKKWIIQDTENMVDLSFSPVSISVNNINAFLVRSLHHTIYGTLEGTLLTADGEKVSFKSLPGIAENYLIRL